MLKKIRYVLMYGNLQDAAAHDRLDEALAWLQRIYDLFCVEGPSAELPVKTNLVAGVVYCRVGDAEAAAAAAEAVLARVELHRSRIGSANVTYLEHLAAQTLAFARKISGKPLSTVNVEDLLKNPIDLSRVRRHLRDQFPLQS